MRYTVVAKKQGVYCRVFCVSPCRLCKYFCAACECNETGSLLGSDGQPLSCNSSTGQCQCKLYVTGQRCDECLDGYWNFQPDSDVGCERTYTPRALQQSETHSSDALNTPLWSDQRSWVAKCRHICSHIGTLGKAPTCAQVPQSTFSGSSLHQVE